MLRQRIITALILAALVIGIILVRDTFWVSLLFTLGMFLATRELLKLTIDIPGLAVFIAALTLAVVFQLSLQVMNPVILYWQSLAGTALWVLIAVSLVFYRYHGNWPLLVRVLLLGLGLDLLWICAHGLVYLHYQLGPWVLLYLLTLVSVADIGAYCGGKQFGKRKLAPAISPGKTWEGVIGGLLSNLLWMSIVYLLADNLAEQGLGMPLTYFILIGLATSLVSVVGDLFESVLKREAGVKDSGSLLPGHGGMLDRIDGVIAASPVFVGGLFLAGVA